MFIPITTEQYHTDIYKDIILGLKKPCQFKHTRHSSIEYYPKHWSKYKNHYFQTQNPRLEICYQVTYLCYIALYFVVGRLHLAPVYCLFQGSFQLGQGLVLHQFGS